MIKNTLRWILGNLLAKAGLAEKVRGYYFSMARRYVENLPSSLIEAAWVRRSAANEDFFPIVSDVDVTVLINDREFGSLQPGVPLVRPRLMQDMQLLSKRFLRAWEETGGFRNYQLAHWWQIYGIPLRLNEPASGREELAFELAYETHLIYKQIALKLLADDYDSFSSKKDIAKLGLELKRIQLFWQSGDKGWAVCPRSKIPSPGLLPDIMVLLEDLCQSLITELEPPLNVYDWSKTVTGEDEFGLLTAINFKGYPIVVLRDPRKVLAARKTKGKTFFATGMYLQMIKGIGIQEQGHLNRLASENSYYRKFSCQRLAHDLIGALILEPQNLEQLYFCFYNIAQFQFAITGSFPIKWQEIESFWDQHRDLPWKKEELGRFCVTYLDHVEALL